MKLSTWAKENGITYETAWKWFRDGNLPVEATQLSTGTILVHNNIKSLGTTIAIYARVSTKDRENNLEGQIARVTTALISQGLSPTKVVTEIGSGLNGRRPKLLKLLHDPEITTIAVEHKDRLARFGVEYIEASLQAQKRSIFVVDNLEIEDDLVTDMIDVLTSFCARLYGKRSAKNRAQRAIEAAAL